MATEQKIIRTKVELFELAKQLQNVFRGLPAYGVAEIVFTVSRSCMRPVARPRCKRSHDRSRFLKNRVSPETEQAIAQLALE